MKTYLRHKSLNVIDVRELIALEYLDFEGKYKDYVEKHDFCELCYVECGEITLSLAGERVTLSEGQALLIEPDTEHSYYSEYGNAARVFVICFECAMHTLRSLAGVAFDKDEQRCGLFRLIIDECCGSFRMNERDQLEVLELQSFGGQQAIILLLEYILIGLVRGLSARKNPDIVFLSGDSFHSEFVNIVISYLRDNVERRITLTDVCRRFNYSRSFICKIFKEQTGESLIGYFNRLKLERAKQMLCDGGMTVREISEALGFSEPKYFGISFKNCYGKSPKAYRAECRCGNSL